MKRYRDLLEKILIVDVRSPPKDCSEEIRPIIDDPDTFEVRPRPSSAKCLFAFYMNIVFGNISADEGCSGISVS